MYKCTNSPALHDDIRRVPSRHVGDAISFYRRAGVITPSRHSIAAQFRIAGKTIFRFVPSARDPYRAHSCVINRRKRGAGIVIGRSSVNTIPPRCCALTVIAG